jgi:hypothetical protein
MRPQADAAPGRAGTPVAAEWLRLAILRETEQAS